MDKTIFQYKIADFEGPLDLLLHLITKNKLNILDVPISFLLEQYSEQIKLAVQLDMDVASEFLEMAARLVYIKSVSLLPKHEGEEDEHQKLLYELIEYQTCKDIAEDLRQKYVGNTIFSRNGQALIINKTYKSLHSIIELNKYYKLATSRVKVIDPPRYESFTEIVVKPVISVSSKIINILRRRKTGECINVNDLFSKCSSKSDLIATFLAILELVKANRIEFTENILSFL